MEGSIRQFDKRKRTMHRKHARMARGYVTKMDKSGIIVQRPDNKWIGMLARFLMLMGLCFVAIKTFMLASMGEAAYLDHLSGLDPAVLHERAGAWVMQIDPLTTYLAQLLAPVLAPYLG